MRLFLYFSRFYFSVEKGLLTSEFSWQVRESVKILRYIAEKRASAVALKCTMCRNERFFQLFWNLFLIWSEEFQSSLSMNDDGVGDVDSMTTYYSQYAHTIYTKCYFAFKLQTSSRLCIWMAKRFSLCVLKNCTVGPWRRKIDMSQDI